MKKMFSALSVLSVCLLSAQVYNPTATISTTTNPATNNVGIGTTTPTEKLDVLGNIRTGNTDSTEGINALSIRYQDGSLNNWGSLRSSSSTYMSFGVKADPINGDGWVSSEGSLNYKKIALTLSNDGLSFLSSGQQQTSINSSVIMNTVMNVAPNGDIRVGDIISEGSNSWMFHTPDDGRKSLYIAHKNATNNWDWEKSFVINGENGNVMAQGKFEAKEIKVTLTPTADFVFAEDYNLPKLEDVEKHIKEKKHLPEIASAKEMEKEGVNVGEFQIKLLQKIEELTLYTIEQNKLIKEQQRRIEVLENKK